MAQSTRHLLAGIFLSLTIVTGASVSLRMMKGQVTSLASDSWQAVEAAPSPFVIACAE